MNSDTYLDQITDILYPLQKIRDEHKKYLRVYIQLDGFDYSKGVLIDTLRTIVDGIDTETVVLSRDDGANKRLKPIV